MESFKQAKLDAEVAEAEWFKNEELEVLELAVLRLLFEFFAVRELVKLVVLLELLATLLVVVAAIIASLGSFVTEVPPEPTSLAETESRMPSSSRRVPVPARIP